jgi:hypothetical protein
VLSLFIRIYDEYLTDTVVMIPLLEKFFSVCGRIPFDEILELWKVRSEQDASRHCR